MWTTAATAAATRRARVSGFFASDTLRTHSFRCEYASSAHADEAPAAASADARSDGTSTVRGAVSGAISTSSTSPADTPAADRTAALTGIRNRPPMLATVVR